MLYVRGVLMKKFFDGLTTMSTNRPKTTILVTFLLLMGLSPFAMFINFDNSEDAFFPDNETVRLLNQVEDEYQASLDFLRFIDRIEPGDLYAAETWEQQAILEAILLENSNLSEYQFPLYGVQANNGIASAAMQWQILQDPEYSDWVSELDSALDEVSSANNSDETNSSIINLSSSTQNIPSPVSVNASMLRSWEVGQPEDWLVRLDDGENHTQSIIELNTKIGVLLATNENQQLAGSLGFASVKLNILMGMQSIDYRNIITSNIPAEDQDDPWNSDGPILTNFVVVTEPEEHGFEVIGDVQELITVWSDELSAQALEETGDEDVTVFSFSQLSTGQNANLGKELGILNSLCLLILGLILWSKFRSKRDTAYVLTVTVFAIVATYGMAGLLTLMGVSMVFNAAMNSIPILLLAVGVDYGLHVVMRVREEFATVENREKMGRESLKDFTLEVRRSAVRTGAILTSAALLVAIFTDVIGFLSFRFSSQQFLVSFGTVIAIGLVFIYLVSITALPALMLALPTKRLPLAKATKIEVGNFAKWVGSITSKPIAVFGVAFLLSIPMVAGFAQLEVGFDTRDNFDQSVPVVQDFFLIADEFQSSPAPLYIVINGDVISEDGRNLYNEVFDALLENKNINGVPRGVWDTIRDSTSSNEELSVIISDLDSNQSKWDDLTVYLSSEDGRNLTSSNLRGDLGQTVLSFQAATLDWQATTDFENELSNALQDISDNSNGEFEVMLSGRSLITAQVTADVANSAVISTGTVAGVILFMLIAINSTRDKNVVSGIKKGVITWIPLMVVVVWVYGIMGLTGYELNSQTVTIGALTLGLGVDYAVHFSTRLDEELEANPSGTPAEWTSLASATTGRAMFGTALTTAGGFAVLNFSSLVPLKLFGQVFVVAIIFALASSILLLPALYAPLIRSLHKNHHESVKESE